MATKTTKITFKKKKAIQLWSKHDGHITNICKEAGIARSTLYKWLQKPSFASRIAEQEGILNDEMKQRLIDLARQKNLGAIIYYLRNKHPEFKDKKTTPLTIDKMQVNIINYAKKTPRIAKSSKAMDYALEAK